MDIAGNETELKFDLDPESARRLAQHPALGGAAKTSRLRSTYYDTPAHALRDQGLSLRIRATGEGFVRTVKRRRAVGAIARDEWERTVEADAPDAETFSKTPVGEALNGDAHKLGPVFVTDIQRTTRIWEQGKTVVEVSLDEGEITAGDRREPVRELELELKSGDPADLFALARDLSGEGAMRLAFDSKGERGYRLAGHDGLAAQKAQSAGVAPGATVAEAFRRVARSCLAQVVGNAQLLARVRSPEALHQLRVGLRRFRAGLSVFRPILADGTFARVRGEARWLAGELNGARDLDIFIAAAFPPGEDTDSADPALAALGKRLIQAQADAYERALRAIGSDRFAAMVLEATAWVETGEWATIKRRKVAALRDGPVESFAVEALSKLRRQVRKAGAGRFDPVARHDLRIRVKKLRYATEFLGEALPKASPKRRQRYLHVLREFQDRLGELNDIAVARQTVAAVLRPGWGDVAFAAGVLIGRREQDEPALTAAADTAYAAVRRAKPFWMAD